VDFISGENRYAKILNMRFVVDLNVGKLGRWLRIAGFDTILIKGIDDNTLVRIALDEERILLTRDTGIFKRRVVVNGRLKAILIESDEPRDQLRQVFNLLDLVNHLRPFTRCIECNEVLLSKSREEVAGKVPPHVYRTHDRYMQCPSCCRVYWRGTHWARMLDKINRMSGENIRE